MLGCDVTSQQRDSPASPLLGADLPAAARVCGMLCGHTVSRSLQCAFAQLGEVNKIQVRGLKMNDYLERRKKEGIKVSCTQAGLPRGFAMVCTYMCQQHSKNL
jgi:hypothetical protein